MTTLAPRSSSSRGYFLGRGIRTDASSLEGQNPRFEVSVKPSPPHIASDQGATVELLSVKNVDVTKTWERDGFLAIRVVIVYADLAGARFHTVVRLTDPERGRRRGSTSEWVDLVAEGTTIGEGANPAQQQWRVTFRGQKLDDEQVRRLRADAIQYLGGHSVGSGPTPEAASSGMWSSTVFVAADRSSDAIKSVRTTFGGDHAPFGSWKAEPWGLEPLVFREPTRRERAAEWVRRAWARVRQPRRVG